MDQIKIIPQSTKRGDEIKPEKFNEFEVANNPEKNKFGWIKDFSKDKREIMGSISLGLALSLFPGVSSAKEIGIIESGGSRGNFFVVSSDLKKGCLAVTSKHVVEDANDFKVAFSKKSSLKKKGGYKATIVQKSNLYDLALVEITENGSSANLECDNSPFNTFRTAKKGEPVSRKWVKKNGSVVSAQGQVKAVKVGEGGASFNSNVPSKPGSSGGAMLAKEEVIGVHKGAEQNGSGLRRAVDGEAVRLFLKAAGVSVIKAE